MFQCCRSAAILAVLATAGTGVIRASYAADSRESNASHEMHQSMSDMMKDLDAMKMRNDPDADFAQMMIRHHQAAIEMAQTQLEQGKDAEIKSMSRKTIAAQKKDIAKLQSWLKKHAQQAGAAGD